MKKTITLIMRNNFPVAYAANETKAKKMIMNQLEKHPENYKSAKSWWETTTWNVKQIYSFKEISTEISL